MHKRRNVILLALLILLASAALLGYRNFMPQAQEGRKSIALTVVHGNGEEKEIFTDTMAETLGEALRENGIIDDAPDGFVSVVDGETADTENEEWWCLTQNGEMLMTGVDDTVIADGDRYEFTLTAGYAW